MENHLYNTIERPLISFTRQLAVRYLTHGVRCLQMSHSTHFDFSNMTRGMFRKTMSPHTDEMRVIYHRVIPSLFVITYNVISISTLNRTPENTQILTVISTCLAASFFILWARPSLCLCRCCRCFWSISFQAETGT